jgi:hypothetical protein
MLEENENHVANDEILYRRVLSGRDLYETKTDGTVEFYAQAFGDTEGFRTSVDRAKLCGNDPQYTLGTFSGGVVSLVTLDIRSIEDIPQYSKGGNDQKIIRSFKADVTYAPIINDPREPDNPAHSEIHTTPECPNRGVFKRLRERLALLANARQWELEPGSN